MKYQFVKRSVKRWVELAWEVLLAMDASPSELLIDDMRSLRGEIEELRRQIEERPEPERRAA